ncbi:MAG: J domain-containing protein [Planctomycetota bacterium]|nr:J domain-containing protein [Planctomycetota bacterium]
MANPYRVLGIGEGSDDEEIRASYLDLVRRFPPERDPQTFQRIRMAYEKVADRRSRLRLLIFEPSQGESLGEWIEELQCDKRKARPRLADIRAGFRGT